MPKGGSSNNFLEAVIEDSAIEKRKNIFYFLEGAGTLLWVCGDVSWIFELENVYPIIYVLAVLGNLAALAYAFLKLRQSMPILPIMAYNLWVIMGCLWTFVDATGSERILLIAKGVGAVMLLVTVFEFLINSNNKENLISFMKTFRKFRIREEIYKLGMADVLALPDDLLRLLRWMMRQKEASLAEISFFLKQDEAAGRKTLTFLVEHGYIQKIETGGKTLYRISLAHRRVR